MNKEIKNGRVKITEDYADNLEGTFEEIINKLQRWADEYGVALHNISYEYDKWCDDHGTITYWRDLTDKEREAERVKKEKAAFRAAKVKATKEAKERAEFERLKKKYG